MVFRKTPRHILSTLIPIVLSFALISTLQAQDTVTNSVVPDLSIELKPRRPEWSHKIIATHDNGSPHKVLLSEKTSGKNGTLVPVKLLEYYSEGSLKLETDLDQAALPHGASIGFFEDGQVLSIATYHHGKNVGLYQEFFPSGKAHILQEWKDGLLEGVRKVFNENETLVEDEHFLRGLKHGESKTFFADGGLKKSSAFYVHGHLEGKKSEWYENGSIASIKHYVQGMLQSVESYFETGKIQEQQSFFRSVPNGEHTRYHPNGIKAYSVHYVQGKKNGLESTYSDKGEVLAEGNWKQGVPYGRHFVKDINGTLRYVAVYSELGKLEEPIKEYTAQGALFSEYDPNVGTYKEWYTSGKMKREFNYLTGKKSENCFDGEQKEYYPNGKLFIQTFFSKGLENGEHKEWYEDGKPLCHFQFKNGLKDGKCQSFYPNGHLEEEALYSKGIIEGVHTLWYENGQKQEETTWKEQKLDGKHFVWANDGKLQLQESFVKGVPHGECKEWYPNGKLMREVSFVSGKKDGREAHYFENGKQALLANYVQGALDGDFLSFFEDAKPHEIYHYIKGKPDGEWTEYFPNTAGKTRQIVKTLQCFKDGALHGEQKRFWENGQLQVNLSYDAGVLHGRKALFSEDGLRLFDATYVKGSLQGKVYDRRQNGMEMTQNYKDNLLHGEYIVYYPQRPKATASKVKAYEAKYVEGKLDGEVIEYSESGAKKMSSFYKDGKRDGVASCYTPEGQVTMTAEFKDGKQHGAMVYYFSNGNVSKRMQFATDLQEGEEVAFFENGQKASIAHYKKGKLHGLSQEWNAQGILLFEAEFKDGLKNGKFNKYYETGKLHIEQNFANDVLTSKKVYDEKGFVGIR